jgi:hypothetical protein
MPTKIASCNCEHKAQDEIYGKGNRVFNKTYKDNAGRCTVCGSTKSVFVATETTTKKGKK